MLELGKLQTLEVIKEKDFGVYLAEEGWTPNSPERGVLLPKKMVPEGTKIGSLLDVFLYKDSEDRMIATTSVPKQEAPIHISNLNPVENGKPVRVGRVEKDGKLVRVSKKTGKEI